MIDDNDYDAALAQAIKRDPANSFVDGCRVFLSINGFLSKNQVMSLLRIQRVWPKRQFNNEPDQDEYWD